MTKAVTSNRKVSDTLLLRRNSVGLSLSTIADEVGVHPTTITLRLKALKVPSADTRRSFMDDVYKSLSPDQQEWLADQLGPHFSIKDFVKNAIVEKFINQATA